MHKLKGVTFTEVALICIFIILNLLTMSCCARCQPIRLRDLYLKLKKVLMYNSILRYTQQIFYSITLSAMMNIDFIMKNSRNDKNLTLSIGALVVLTCFSLFTLDFMKKNKKLLPNPDFMAKFGALY